MANYLNLFVAYENSGASHENQLTRALLVVLRYSPIAHAAWLRLVAPEISLHEISKPDFATQRKHVISQSADIPEGDDIPGISVWLAPDATDVHDRLSPSDRQQILDGIVTYGNDLVVVIENKISWDVKTDQPNRINLHGAPVKFQEKVSSVPWQRLLGAFSDLVEHDLVSGAERHLINDFLELVEGNFPQIGPYASLAQCGDNQFRLTRRLDNVQEKALLTDAGKGLGWRQINGTQKIFMAWLGLSDDGSAVCLRMYPADTLGQARDFYRDEASVKSVLALRSKNWSIAPNFHWGFMSTGYAWMKTPLPVDAYCSYWIHQISITREVLRAEWESYWDTLVAARIVEPAEKRLFDQEFTLSQRQKAHPRPGLFCEFTWPLLDARKLDGQGKLVDAVRERTNQMLVALDAPVLSTAKG